MEPQRGQPQRSMAPQSQPAPQPLQPLQPLQPPGTPIGDTASPSGDRTGSGQGDEKDRPLKRATNRLALYGIVGTIILAGAISLFSWFGGSSGGEKDSPNHEKVVLVSKQADRHLLGFEPLGGGSLTFVPAIGLLPADLDATTTAAVQQAAKAGDWTAVDRAIQQATHIPQPQTDPAVDKNPRPIPVPTPVKLPEELRPQVQQTDVAFYTLYVYDSCVEDGDVVQILVNGKEYLVIPLTRQGAKVVIPIPKGGAAISVRGLRDGEGGGVTTGVRTSAGNFYLRALREGETLDLGFTRP
jgi:hypothetical protein